MSVWEDGEIISLNRVQRYDFFLNYANFFDKNLVYFKKKV